MAKKDPHDPVRRKVLEGGLLGAAAALGLLACGDDGAQTGPGGAGGQGGSSGQGGAGGQGTGGSGGGDPMAIPTAVLGGTGEEVSILGLGTHTLGQGSGGNPMGAAYQEVLDVFEAAIDRGITYLDTAHTYGRAQEALGEVIQGRRDELFIVTKLWADNETIAAAQFENALSQLGIDYVDVLHLHDVGSRDVNTALGPGGAWPYILQQKAMGRTRFTGITGHSNTANFIPMLQTDQVDVMMVAMNFVDYHTYGFETNVLPEAVSRDVGVMSMKVFGGCQAGPSGGFHYINESNLHPSQMEVTFDHDALRDGIRYAKSLDGVTGFVIGIGNATELDEVVQWTLETTPFSSEEMEAVLALGETVAASWAGRFG